MLNSVETYSEGKGQDSTYRKTLLSNCLGQWLFKVPVMIKNLTLLANYPRDGENIRKDRGVEKRCYKICPFPQLPLSSVPEICPTIWAHPAVVIIFFGYCKAHVLNMRPAIGCSIGLWSRPRDGEGPASASQDPATPSQPWWPDHAHPGPPTANKLFMWPATGLNLTLLL